MEGLFDSFERLDSAFAGPMLQTSQQSLIPAKPEQQQIRIERVPLGAKILAQNPDGSGFDALRGHASDWQRVELVVHREDGAVLEVEQLKHCSDSVELSVGQWYHLRSDEHELSGLARVVAIDDDVSLGDGPGNLVVSRFKTTATKEVVRVTLANGDQIVGTPGHRTWCVNRQSFIGLSEFEDGDTVDTLEGETQVSQIETGFETQTVFNLEVAGQHVYRVGSSGLLVHNTCVDDLAKNAPEFGGFARGISADNITDLGRKFGGGTPLLGDPSTALLNASYQNGFFNKAASLIRDISGRHMFTDANKRTTQAVIEELMKRNGITSGPTSETLRSIIQRSALGSNVKGSLNTIDEIASALRGF